MSVTEQIEERIFEALNPQTQKEIDDLYDSIAAWLSKQVLDPDDLDPDIVARKYLETLT